MRVKPLEQGIHAGLFLAFQIPRGQFQCQSFFIIQCIVKDSDAFMTINVHDNDDSQNDDDLKNEDNLKNEIDGKSKDDIKNEADLKNENDL